MRLRNLVLAAILLGVVHSSPLLAWGQDGHRITAELAERHLDSDVWHAVHELLGGESLAQIATWPDEIRSYPSWDCAKPYHYVTVPPGSDYPGQGLKQGDSVQALVYFTDLLHDAESDTESRRIALRFIVHLVGDMHQPLHNGRGCDRGGNALKVNWFRESVVFHTVWDSLLIQSENLSFDQWADFLDHPTEEQRAEIVRSTPVDWVDESQRLLDAAYTCFTKADRCPCFCGDCADGRSRFGGCNLNEECSLMVSGPVEMSYGYKAVNLEVVRKQLLKGGLRLAHLLEWALRDNADPPLAFAEMAAEIRALPNYDASCLASCRGTSSIDEPAPPADPACETTSP